MAQGEPQRRALRQRVRPVRLHPERGAHAAAPHGGGHLGFGLRDVPGAVRHPWLRACTLRERRAHEHDAGNGEGHQRGAAGRGLHREGRHHRGAGEGLGIPAENLKKTVERQNENYDNQVDPDFGKEAFRLSPVRKAPFYGVRTSGYMLCTLDGITINENFQAVNEEGEAIEGLYVTGVDSGSYYAHTYPNMSTGNCCGRSVTFARMIGKALAAK
ncbi:MAG: FAD-binding protein [Eggerthella lenta]